MITRHPTLEDDFWSEFAGEADDIVDNCGKDCDERVQRRLDGILAKHRLVLRDE